MDITLLYPKAIDWNTWAKNSPDVPFSDAIIAFLNALSGSILRDPESKKFPDVVTFAFFCRKGNILSLKEKYATDGGLRLGRGLLFHIAPSNVPINFGYSLVAGLLAGNNNVVRISNKPFAQIDLVIKHLFLLLNGGEHNEVASRIALVRYEHSSEANAYFSSVCNVRVIWGGDATISSIRQNPIPPRSFDVCFADRYSIAAIRPNAIIKASDSEITKLAEAFYNDTYLFDQNACSAPHIVFWEKDTCLKDAQDRFWNAVYKNAKKKYQLQAVMSVDKLTAFYRQAICLNVKKISMPDNLVFRSELQELPKNIEEFRCSCGFFSEYIINSLDEIAPIINVKYQSMGYFGFNKDELNKFVLKHKLTGLDRIVPIGETTAFSLTWDGYNLIDTFTRIPSII